MHRGRGSRRPGSGSTTRSPAATRLMASASCSAGASLTTKPLAPASMARRRYPGRPNVVRMSGTAGRHLLAEDGRRGQAVDPWHLDVEQGDVGARPPGRGDHLVAAPDGCHHGEVLFEVEKGGQGLADQLLVVRQEEADGQTVRPLRREARRIPASPLARPVLSPGRPRPARPSPPGRTTRAPIGGCAGCRPPRRRRCRSSPGPAGPSTSWRGSGAPRWSAPPGPPSRTAPGPARPRHRRPAGDPPRCPRPGAAPAPSPAHRPG